MPLALMFGLLCALRGAFIPDSHLPLAGAKSNVPLAYIFDLS